KTAIERRCRIVVSTSSHEATRVPPARASSIEEFAPLLTPVHGGTVSLCGVLGWSITRSSGRVFRKNGMPTVRVKAGHVQPVWAGHPWVYAQAIDRIEGGATAGDEVRVVDPRGNTLGRGFYSPASAIPVRILVRDDTTKLDGHFF